ncbi:MAG: MBL fold metallo-hydrolase [Pseudomonadota bacterium]
MKQFRWIYENGKHRWGAVSRDPARNLHLIDTNEYLVVNGGEALICDPGGTEIFPMVFSALSREFDPGRIKYVFASHQDPDIASSLALWCEANPELKCLVSWLWSGFLPHFGVPADTFVAIPDEGMPIALGNLILKLVPAHYLHSSGNFHLYDEKAKLLFSGDVGAALLPGDSDLFVRDFDTHIKSAELFHKRWMGSNEAKQRWCERVSCMEIDMLCPQHGAIYQGADVGRFIDWFAALKVGSAP